MTKAAPKLRQSLVCLPRLWEERRQVKPVGAPWRVPLARDCCETVTALWPGLSYVLYILLISEAFL
jgi:hypothetical protein